MIKELVELLRKLDEGSWIEIEEYEQWPDYVCIDGRFEIEKIEDWLSEVKAQVWDEGYIASDDYYGEHDNPYRQGETE